MPDDRPAEAAASPRARLSAFLIVKDEAARLPRTLAALEGLADEVVVVDSGSSDATVEIARAAGARVEHRDWEGYGPQKRFAEGLCAHDWVLNVDADEVVTPALAAEIRALLAQGPAPGAYAVRILNVYPGDARPRPFADDYLVVRLYHRAAGTYRDHPLFDRVEVSGPAGRLRAPIHHFPFLDWHGLVAKENAYSSWQAEAARRRPGWLLRVRLVTEGPWVFLKSLLLRRHVLGGWKGVAFSGVIAFARWLRIVKLLAREEDRRR
ncbi:MAG: glycosyltransferase family 2 protein [Pseudomonadota bacterium]